MTIINTDTNEIDCVDERMHTHVNSLPFYMCDKYKIFVGELFGI